MAFAKIAILLFLRRALGINDKIRIFINVTIGAVIVWLLFGLLYAFLSCRPIPFYWDKTIENGWCVDNSQYMTVSIVEAVVAMLLDLAILVIPIKPVWNMRTTMARKIAISGILSVGLM